MVNLTIHLLDETKRRRPWVGFWTGPSADRDTLAKKNIPCVSKQTRTSVCSLSCAGSRCSNVNGCAEVNFSHTTARFVSAKARTRRTKEHTGLQRTHQENLHLQLEACVVRRVTLSALVYLQFTVESHFQISLVYLTCICLFRVWFVWCVALGCRPEQHYSNKFCSFRRKSLDSTFKYSRTSSFKTSWCQHYN
jgi:hypothetical protein